MADESGRPVKNPQPCSSSNGKKDENKLDSRTRSPIPSRAHRIASSSPSSPSSSTSSSFQYVQRLRQWLDLCYAQTLAWQVMQYPPWAYVYPGAAGGTPPACHGYQQQQHAVGVVPVQSHGSPADRQQQQQRQPGAQGAANILTGQGGHQAGRQFTVPTLTRRLAAEAVDFLILCCFKVSVTVGILYRSGIKDPSDFALHLLLEDINEETSVEEIQRMIIVALVYRLLVCLYEWICVWGIGGATPGKFLLGMRVLSCDSCVTVQADRVLLLNPTNVGMAASAVRSVIKNISIAAFLPALTTVFFNQHNRAGYDVVAGTVVVRTDVP
ncbi:protein FAM8A1 [Petromyzon marinus]|uniref:protein FAM8A1 n=1 Tax=Petromyzon marinus TaxID=7757 RepID=UPI003F72B52F